jgi:peptidyl-tRNA hydrolase, PTH1 family
MLGRLRQGDRRERGAPGAGEPVWLIVGLGNPGKRYHATRHNAGFMAIDQLRGRFPGGTARSRFQADFVETRDGERRVVLAKPQTFMNESGVAVSQLARWFKVPRERLLVIYDELDLPFGQIRLRGDGSAGGHNGMKSIIQHLHSQDFARLRIGIDRPQAGANVPYVLSNFSNSEQRELPAILDRACEATLAWLREGVDTAMNEFNRRVDDAALGPVPANPERRQPDRAASQIASESDTRRGI